MRPLLPNECSFEVIAKPLGARTSRPHILKMRARCPRSQQVGGFAITSFVNNFPIAGFSRPEMTNSALGFELFYLLYN